MPAALSQKFRSTFHGIDLKLLRMLCDLHPWSMAELCKEVDMEPSVLSMVLSGKRPLPTRVARQFLVFMGMKEDGSLDPTHGFILKAKAGRAAQLQEVENLLFPEAPGKCLVTMLVPDPENPDKPPTQKSAFVLYFGNFIAVLHVALGSPDWLRESEIVAARYYAAPEVLLSLEKLPNKLDMLKAFAGSEIGISPTWEDVIEESRRRNVEARVVQEWLINNFSVPTPQNFVAHQGALRREKL